MKQSNLFSRIFFRDTIDNYKDKGFNRYQLEEIELGLNKKLDVSFYAKLEFNCEQMSEIRNGLMAGVDVSIYAKSCYNHLQMYEILQGLHKNLDVSYYLNPDLSSEAMSSIRKSL